MEDVVGEVVKALVADFEGVSLHICEIERAWEVGCAEVAFYIIGIGVVADAHLFSVKIKWL